MTEQDIQYAKKYYPIGTKYKCASDEISIHIIIGDKTTYKNMDTMIYADDGKGCLFHSGRWAEIIPDSKLEKVINDYSIY